ncbi:DNA-binding GntR family transcriptional regulator [Caldicoprobacter guelmensis]|uniref:GntR family transcriptional regulator n=1 Tax=Caldicoprobacter guelmensis TaxID=1170224 RepID=UPI001956B025|nr:GntR family transcriptional regulator [Caldicoprobacter guelmensis]MBM7583425.1 DNA-binding GntR family transcriptional regulator [Caldicoprobacter guelmensis]
MRQKMQEVTSNNITNNITKRGFKPLSLKEITYRVIKEKLLNLEIEPGSRIREDILAEEMSVSRTPVREAVRQLVAEGFIRDIPRKGLFFIDFTPDVISDLLDVREALEKLAVRKCIEKITRAQLKELEQLVKKFEESLNVGEYENCNILDSMFHKKIVEITGNKKLIDFVYIIEEFMQIVRKLEMYEDKIGKNINALEDHKKILEAIRNKDKEKAETAVKNNIESMKKNLGLK